ncbi:MAG: PilZ domain-containing protein [Nitrospirae bacterium]|nr:MAG: PilZ domain-containing protein [Nitrospirota bacterium]
MEGELKPVKEMRRHKRYEVQGVNGSLTFSVDAKIINMSLEGMAIETTRRLNINSDYSVRLRHEDQHLELKGKVVWSTLSRTEKTPDGDIVPIYKAGIRFVDILDEKSRAIISFIENNRIVTLEKRILGRFRMGAKSALLEYPQDYVVRKMSLSGMLIETEMPLEKEDRVDMSLKIPDSGEITIKGRVASVNKKDESEDFYLLGIEFIDLGQDEKNTLSEYLKKVGDVEK